MNVYECNGKKFHEVRDGLFYSTRRGRMELNRIFHLLLNELCLHYTNKKTLIICFT